MADARDIIHQIEYRWHDKRDLSPVASTMSPESLHGWDSWIRTWVRHPHVDGLWESVRYQIRPNGRAALAWRFEDRQVAGSQDGTRGRPLVSRVLAGHADLLTPDVAIAACRTGLPSVAGPRPGQVGTESELPVIAADELSALVGARSAGLDEDAAQEEGLRQTVAAALSDPHTPVAIQLQDPDILKPPAEGSQCPLLWGLWRIAGPLLGSAGRGWSFSTFEPPLAEVDPETLPDILFRRVLDTPLAAPARPRKELKVRPFQPMPAEDGNPDAELAGWLVAEYRERGGDGLMQLITQSCGPEPSVQRRLSKIYEELRAGRSPVITSTPPEPAEPARDERPAQSWFDPAFEEPPAPEPTAYEEPLYPEPTAYYGPFEYPEPSAYPSPALEPEPLEPEPLEPEPSEYHEPPEYPDERIWTGRTQRSRTPAPLPLVSDLLRRLPEAADIQEFISILRYIFGPDTQPDANDRVKARREVSQDDWYGKICKICQLSENLPLVDILSGILQVIVIPDLNNTEVAKKITEWASREPPAVIGGLLAAAKQADDGTWLFMRNILAPTLAHRWAIDNEFQELYPVSVPQRGIDSGRGPFSFFKKN